MSKEERIYKAGCLDSLKGIKDAIGDYVSPKINQFLDIEIDNLHNEVFSDLLCGDEICFAGVQLN